MPGSSLLQVGGLGLDGVLFDSNAAGDPEYFHESSGLDPRVGTNQHHDIGILGVRGRQRPRQLAHRIDFHVIEKDRPSPAGAAFGISNSPRPLATRSGRVP